MNNEKHIRITTNNGQVDHDNQPIKKNGEEAVWDSGTGAAFQVVFRADSPFDRNEFNVPAGGSVSSGTARADAADKPYKYDVVGPGGTNDPTIIIQR
jgi:hypothetical protein